MIFSDILPEHFIFLLSAFAQAAWFFSDRVLNNSSFLLHEQKKRNKENSPSALFSLLQSGIPLKKKNSLTLKQLFLFNVPSLSLRLTPKK